MKKIILTFLLTLSFYSFSENWQDKWSEACFLMEKSQFDEAKNSLNQAISLMELQDNHPYLYVDRARLNLLLGSEDVLGDLDLALSSDQLVSQEKIRAITTKLIVLGRLGSERAILDTIKNFKALVNLPTVEIKDSKLILRNIPNSEYYKKLMTCYLIHSGICYDKDEFTWMKSGMLVAEKINHCGCQKCIAEYAKTRVCDSCLAVVNPGKENVLLGQLIVEGVRYCGSEVKQLEDQTAFLTALLQIQNMGKSIEFFDDTFDNIFSDIDKSKSIFWD